MKELIFKLKETIYTGTTGTTTISTDFILKQSFRALLLYEELFGIQYIDDGKMNSRYKLLYCMLRAANKVIFNYNYDQFIDLLDDNQDSVEEFIKYLKSLALPDADFDDKKKAQ